MCPTPNKSMGNESKVCTKCRTKKPLDEFGKKAVVPDGRTSW